MKKKKMKRKLRITGEEHAKNKMIINKHINQ